MNYNIIGTGSSGNAVIVDDMLFDVGLPYGKIGPHLEGIKYIFITHRHTDHLKMSTVKFIKREYPKIIWIGSWDVASRVILDYTIGDTTVLKFKDRKVKCFPCVHDVPCHGYVVERKGSRIIYATDTASLEHAPKLKYDYMFIESNHDENKIRAIMGKAKKLYGYDAWENAMRHLSTQKSKAFYYLNRRNKDSKWIELHQSKRFY